MPPAVHNQLIFLTKEASSDRRERYNTGERMSYEGDS